MMKIWQAGLALSGIFFLGACGSIARSAADTTEVSVLPLANAEVSGTLEDEEATAGQSLVVQKMTKGTLSYSASFDDFDASTLPSILGSPSALDVPIAINSAFFSCKPTAPTMNVVIKSATLSAKDAGTPGGVSSSQNNLNIVVPMNRAADGTYSVSGVPTNLLTLNLNWAAFAPVVVKTGVSTPNTATLSLGVQVDNASPQCVMKLKLSSSLKQKVRF